MKNIDIIASIPQDSGWTPVWQMIDLLHSYTEGDLLKINPQFSQSKFVKLLGLLPKVNRNNDCSCIVVVSDPGIVNSIMCSPRIRYRYEKIYLWVIDSFWSERIPRVLKKNKIFEKCYVMDQGDIAAWRKAVSLPLDVLPWGADVLNVKYSDLTLKNIDVARVGRQPSEWGNDTKNSEFFSKKGIIYGVSPRIIGSNFESEANLESLLTKSKFLLAFNNLKSPESYTHPTRSYLTSRWAKGISYGCLMLGAVPVSATARELIPDWGHVEISPISRDDACATIVNASREWDSSIPIKLHAYACKNFDWRYRFAQIFSDIGFKSEALEHDLKLLKQRAERLESPDD